MKTTQNPRIYLLKNKYNRKELLGGRKINYVSREICYNREHVALILKGEFPCSKKTAEDLIKALSLKGSLDDYFYMMNKEEYETWKKTLKN